MVSRIRVWGGPSCPSSCIRTPRSAIRASGGDGQRRSTEGAAAGSILAMWHGTSSPCLPVFKITHDDVTFGRSHMDGDIICLIYAYLLSTNAVLWQERKEHAKRLAREQHEKDKRRELSGEVSELFVLNIPYSATAGEVSLALNRASGGDAVVRFELLSSTTPGNGKDRVTAFTVYIGMAPTQLILLSRHLPQCVCVCVSFATGMHAYP